ncbi:MAG: hypothetical protein ACK56W_02995 [Pirellula sp.]|jgi:hypothetical protein|nr:hypothetical protein [Pirellula sp.]
MLEPSSQESRPLPNGIPAGSELLPVVFTEDRNKGHRLLHTLPKEFHTFAVVGHSGRSVEGDRSGNPTQQIEFLTVPSASYQASELQDIVGVWVDASTTSKTPRQMMTLQGAEIHWNETRFAILAPPERLEALRTALIETCWFDAELARLERELASAWPEMHQDMPLAFNFDEKSLPRRKELQRRFERVTSIRSRLLRMSPYVYCPHIYPPTLASQLAERYRERTRLLHRHEIIDSQLEVFERVYDNCGQRISDFVQSRTGHILEWIIIILLVLQMVIWGFEILTSLEPTTVAQ